jgi:hypothetical protein
MRWQVLIPVAGMLACNDPASPDGEVGPLLVQPENTTYVPGAAASIKVTNLSRVRLNYTPCFYRIERFAAGGQWVVVYADRNPCPAVLQHLDPWASKEIAVQLPSSLQPEAHRVRFPSIGESKDGAFVMAAQVGDSFVVRP